ncbi:hypothetical protein KSC_005160 [Ktedonobacter sp. SOSP1-52]|nr:hypothetical protein KSC_005160 [Ktedonobacter sp. SOSP1-52]
MAMSKRKTALKDICCLLDWMHIKCIIKGANIPVLRSNNQGFPGLKEEEKIRIGKPWENGSQSGILALRMVN